MNWFGPTGDCGCCGGPPCFNNCIPAPTLTISGADAPTSPSAPDIDGTYDVMNTDPYPCTDEQDIYDSGVMRIQLTANQGSIFVGPDLYLRLYVLIIYNWGAGCAYFFEYESLTLASAGCPSGDTAVTFSSRGFDDPGNPICTSGTDIGSIATPTVTFNFA